MCVCVSVVCVCVWILRFSTVYQIFLRSSSFSCFVCLFSWGETGIWMMRCGSMQQVEAATNRVFLIQHESRTSAGHASLRNAPAVVKQPTNINKTNFQHSQFQMTRTGCDQRNNTLCLSEFRLVSNQRPNWESPASDQTAGKHADRIGVLHSSLDDSSQ